MNRVATVSDAVNAPIASSPDVIVIGCGAGGATMAWALAHRGVKVLLLERGEAVPREADNASFRGVFRKPKYSLHEKWFDHTNLLVADGSILPSSAVLNPAPTIVAQSLRAEEHILRVDFSLTNRHACQTTSTHPTKAPMKARP